MAETLAGVYIHTQGVLINKKETSMNNALLTMNITG